MKKIFDFIAQIAKDKLLHMVLCGVMAAIAILVCKVCGMGTESVAYGWAAGFAAGIIKEIYDEVHGKHSEAADWAADLIGCTSVCLYSLVIML